MLKQITTGAVLSLMLAGAAVAAPSNASAPGWQGKPGMMQRHRAPDFSRLKGELAITASQEAAWTRFTQAATAFHQRPARPAPPATAKLTPAPQVFARFADMAAARAGKARDLSNAAAALYKALSPTQRAVFDTHLADFMAMHRHHRHGHGPRDMEQGAGRPPRR